MDRTPRFPIRLVVDLPNWVGDQMMAMPAVNRLVEANRGGLTVLHTRPPMARLLAEVFPDVDVVSSPRGSSPFASLRTVCRGRGRFDVGVTLRNAARAKLMISAAGRWSIGSCGEGAGILLSRCCPIDRDRHQVFDGDPILVGLGLNSADPSWQTPLSATLVAEGRAVLADVGVGAGRAVGLAPTSARGEAKRWPAERFSRLADRLIQAGLQPVIVVGPGETDVARRALPTLAVPVVGQNLDVAGLAGVMAGLRALVCNDSGPMHVASAIGIPTVALFGPTDPSRTAPLGDANEVLRFPVECSPCFEERCPFSHHACMAEISVETAARALERVLSRC